MDIGDWESSKFLNDTYRYLRSIGWEAKVAELEAFGFTIIENALAPAEVERVRRTLLDVSERRGNPRIDPETVAGLTGFLPGTPLLTNLLFEDPLFEDLLLRPEPMALVRYLMGQSVKLTSVTSNLKAGDADGLFLHADAGNGFTSPLPPYAAFCNLTYALTDYSREGGALAIVPGSHRWCRHPSDQESSMHRDAESPLAVPIEVPAGTAILWHGNTWHGAFPRRTKGLRMNLIYAFCRQFVETQENIKGRVPDAAWERHRGDEIFAGLMNAHGYHGWDDESFAKASDRSRQAGLDWHA
jgi:hypothetical protein